MSHAPIARSPDLRRLQDEGYTLRIVDQAYLLVDNVPYVTAQGEVHEAMLVMNLALSDDVTVPPDTHVAHWTGKFPHRANGEKLIALLQEGAGTSSLSDSLPPGFQFSAKPDSGAYTDYHHKVTTYVEILGREARQLDPEATAQQWKVSTDHEDDENVFHFADTASARQNTTDLSRKLQPERVAIVGAGGTGSYVLDFVAKTWVQEIHLFDDDPFLQHNAFRSPGSFAREEIEGGPIKASLHAGRYASMRKGIVALAACIDDTGIDTAHFAFEGKNVFELFLPGAIDEDGSGFSHGTAVAGLIAGVDDPDFGFDAPGVAWGADLVVFALPLGTAPELYDPITLDDLPGTSEYFAQTVNEILSWSHEGRSIEFLNLSLGVSGVIDNFSEAQLREHFSAATAAFAQAGADEKVVFVWAAGNAHGTPCDVAVVECVDGAVDAVSPGLLAGLAARLPELRGHTVSVVAIGQDGEITGFSNRCGIAAEHCLAAPGGSVRVAYFGPFEDGPGRGAATGGGTSFAAPMVTGGLALMKQHFRGQLAGTDLLARLLETADRTGPYADAEIYGRGLMDLGAATSPVGAETVAVSTRVDGPGATLRQTSLELGSAFGDSVALSLAGREMVTFDSLGAPFWRPAGHVATLAPGPSQVTRLRELLVGAIPAPDRTPESALPILLFSESTRTGEATPALRLMESPGSATARASHVGLAGKSLVLTVPIAASLSATALTTEGMDNPGTMPDTSLVSLVWQLPDVPGRFRVGRMAEPRSLLGAVADGAFGRLSAGTTFAGLEADARLGGWRLGFNAEAGTVSAGAREGLLDGISDISTSAFSLRADRSTRRGGAFRVSLSQPLRTESGRAELDLPVGRTKSGEVVRDAVALGLEPSGRQLDLELHWQQPLGRGTLHLGAVLSREPGHRGDEDPDLTVLSGWTRTF